MNLLICGGYNWITYNIIENALKRNKIKKIVIYDNFEFMSSKFSSIFINECQSMLEEYKHLYDDIIYVIPGDCKDKNKLQEIYNNFNINIVINNIKYNYNKSIKENNNNLYISHENIIQLNVKYNIYKYISINRYYSHNHIHLKTIKYNIKDETYLTYFNIFNMQKIMNPDTVYNINYTDYLYGNHITNNTNIHYKYNYLNKIGTTPYIFNDNFYISNDNDIVNTINLILYNNYLTHENNIKYKKIDYKYLNQIKNIII